MATITARRLLSLATRNTRISSSLVPRAGTSSTSTSIDSIWGNVSRRWSSDYPSHEVVGMPSLSPTMEAGTIAEWNVKEGESYAAGDVLCEVETDKATVSFEAQDDGVVAKILADAGPTEIDCGVPILITVEEEEDADAFKDYVVEASSIPEEVPATATPPPEVAPTPVVAEPTPAPAASPATTGGKVVASPLAWTVAKEKGLDLLSLTMAGTGPGGRIIADDVREYVPVAAAATEAAPAAQTASAPTPAAAPIVGENYTDFPLNEAAIATANQLAHSKQTIPHYYLTVDVTLDALLELRSTLNATLGDDSHISLNDLLLKAAASAMKACPSANASWMGDSVRMYDNVDMNVVMGSGDDLYAPLISGVDGRGVKSLSDEISDNLNAIEKGAVSDPKFGAVGTVTVMNLGMYGVKSCAPIIRAPQAVALALGAAENRIVPNEDDDDDEIYKTSVALTATLSCDHRVVDGAVGAQWLSAFKAAVESPVTLLL